MTFIQMSVSGGVLIGVIAGIRALFINRLPKKTFLALWAVALLRLLLPFSISSPLSVYGLLGEHGFWLQESRDASEKEVLFTEWESGQTQGLSDDRGLQNLQEGKDLVGPGQAENQSQVARPGQAESQGQVVRPGEVESQTAGASAGIAGLSHLFRVASLWTLVWAVGAGVLATYFLISYIRCCREFGTSLPVEEEGAEEWLRNHGKSGCLGRTIALRKLQGIFAPLTYGILHPVILVPKEMDWGDKQSVAYVLEHERIHIQRLDALTKLLLTLVLCLHWFNPLVWLLYLLANRDLELSCDEEVIRRFGPEARASYARTLIGMEEARSRLLPFYSGFSKNAIQERITAIMKHHRYSLAALGAALALVLGISAAFATSARPDSLREALTSLPGKDFTREESQMLFDLWVEGYEDMTVSAYQEQMWQMTDTLEYRELLERFSQWDCVYELPDGREAEALSAFIQYYFSVFAPLTGDRWREREVSDGVQYYAPGTGEPAFLEYVLHLAVLDEEKLLVGTYEAAAPAVHEGLRDFLMERSLEELRDWEGMLSALEEESRRLEQKSGTENLSLSLEYSYIPVGEPGEVEDFLSGQISARVRENWALILKPYEAFGLTWEYAEDSNGGSVRMYYEDREVRGIWDEAEQTWISEHSGYRDYATDAVELIAVYEEGRLNGLRPATREEQKEWDTLRGKGIGIPEAEGKREEEPEERQFSPGTSSDYESLLALKTADYQERTLAEFNQELLDWCNQNPESMERIGEDVFRGDAFGEASPVSLTPSEKDFVAFTFPFSREENYRRITSLQTGEPVEAARVGGRKFFQQEERTGSWCSLYYVISYRIEDPETITVGERNACMKGILKEIGNFWENTSLKELLSMGEEQVTEYFQSLARQYSSEQLTISVNEDQIQFEHRGGASLVSWDGTEILQYGEDGGFYIHKVFANFSGKTIVGMVYGMLAFDGEGKPLKLQWDFLDSSGERAYEHVVQRDDLKIESGTVWEEPGGWSLAEPVNDVLLEVRQLTFSDGTVWENPGYEDWLAQYGGEDSTVTEFRDYYPRETEILWENPGNEIF